MDIFEKSDVRPEAGGEEVSCVHTTVQGIPKTVGVIPSSGTAPRSSTPTGVVLLPLVLYMALLGEARTGPQQSAAMIDTW
eukprot:2184480-Rhodomonas_salina.1